MIYHNRMNSTKIVTAGQVCITNKHVLRGLIKFVVVDGMCFSIFNMMYHNRWILQKKLPFKLLDNFSFCLPQQMDSTKKLPFKLLDNFSFCSVCPLCVVIIFSNRPTVLFETVFSMVFVKQMLI